MPTSLRLDPGHLPVRWQARLDDKGRLPEEASLYMDDGGVVVKRRLSGLPLTLSLPFRAFEGVAVRIVADGSDELAGLVAHVELKHRDPALSVPLAVTRDMELAAGDWQSWSQRLGLPMLLIERDGQAERVGPAPTVIQGTPMPRRRVASLTARRPRFLVRRKMGDTGEMPVLTGWREIISYE